LQRLGGQVLVVDSGSQDRTVEVARTHHAEILTYPFESHTQQWQWALAQLDSGTEWVLGLDADQRLSPELVDELVELFGPKRSLLERYDGFYLNRRQIFHGRWIRHGGYYPKYLLKLFRRSQVRFDELDLVDHHFHIPGRTTRLRFDLIEDNQKERDLAYWIEKHARYARLHAREEFLRGSIRTSWAIRPDPLGSPDQKTAWLKLRWYQLPLFLRPFILFFYRYILRRGFLDGKEGFIFHFNQSLWYRILVDAYIGELEKRHGRESIT
jgi:glycosyltransferase involved in cell wall biosynthesis